MTEAALFSLASNLFNVMSSPAFQMAYERVKSIWGAKAELDKLIQTIGTIQAVLLDAEKRQDDSAVVKDWIQRARDVLYEADNLIDDVSTEVLLKQRMRESKRAKVQAAFSKLLNPIVSNDNIVKRVNAIRERLDGISRDMAHFNFISSKQISGLRERPETRPLLGEEVVIGRDDEKKAILEFLFDKSGLEESVSVIGIVGIGGMGKTTLAQLVYNNEEVQNYFENRWWACISDIYGVGNVLEKIARSIDKDLPSGSDPREFISRSVKNSRSYLLVLDDVWDNDLGKWVDIMSLLRSAKGSKIIVTTRFESVPRVVKKDKFQVYKLNGLSDEKSWELFKRIAFTEEQENDPRWTSLGREIVQKCVNVPLAIKSIAILLLEKNTLPEWEYFKDKELSKIQLSGNSMMSTLKLSYDHLPSNLKNCFAYCSMFPQDYVFDKEDLILQWIAQGYVMPSDNNTFEEVGHIYFMELFRKSFFEEANENKYGEIQGFKMHDLIHDLAKEVAGKESVTLTTGWDQFPKNARHLYVCCHPDFRKLPDANQIRSCFFTPNVLSHSQLFFDGFLAKLKLLRSLNLSDQGLKHVPCSIGNLKHLRYLNLSRNEFTSLPDSLTKLVNLLTLDISYCPQIQDWPNDLKKLIKLRHFYNRGSFRSVRPRMQMPAGLEQLTCLQRLSVFMVSKNANSSTRLDVLARMRLNGRLTIEFEQGIEDWDEDEQWQLPTTLQDLRLYEYPGRRIPHWELGTGRQITTDIALPNLVSILIYSSSTIEHLPPFRCLPYLRSLSLWSLCRLEYVEEDEDENEANEGGGQSSPSPGRSTTFFPCLEILDIFMLGRLKGWSRKSMAHNHPSFPLLSELNIQNCEGLKWMPLCPRLRKLNGDHMSEELMQQLFSASSCSSLETVTFRNMEMLSFWGQTLTSLRRLRILYCNKLKRLNLAPRLVNVLEELDLMWCSELELWEEEEIRGVEWDSLPNLRKLAVNRLSERLPHSLQKLVDGGQLQVSDRWGANSTALCRSIRR